MKNADISQHKKLVIKYDLFLNNKEIYCKRDYIAGKGEL